MTDQCQLLYVNKDVKFPSFFLLSRRIKREGRASTNRFEETERETELRGLLRVLECVIDITKELSELLFRQPTVFFLTVKTGAKCTKLPRKDRSPS